MFLMCKYPFESKFKLTLKCYIFFLCNMESLKILQYVILYKIR